MTPKHHPIVEVKRHNHETATALMRRFSRKVQQARVVKEVRAVQFRVRPLSDKKKKMLTLRRMKRMKELEYLRKLGKV